MPKQNKKILVILPQSIGGRLTTSSIIDGFLSLNFDVDIFDMLDDKKILPDTNTYDFIIGYDYGAIEFCEKYNFRAKMVNYFSDVIQDSHSGKDWKKYYPFLSYDDTITFYWDKELTRNEKIKNLFYQQHFVNTEIYKKNQTKKVYDVIFTGRLDTDYRLNTFLDLIKSLPDLKFGWFAFEKHFKDALNRVRDDDKRLLKEAYQYFIDNEQEMAKVLNQSKIVINFNEQGISSLNYRTIQSMACETLLISDYRAEGIEYFKENFIYYNTFDELVKKTAFFASNDKAREDVTQSLRKIIEKEFSHKNGVQKMLKKIEEVFNA